MTCFAISKLYTSSCFFIIHACYTISNVAILTQGQMDNAGASCNTIHTSPLCLWAVSLPATCGRTTGITCIRTNAYITHTSAYTAVCNL